MKKYLVVGNPIEHSLSPQIHNYWIKKNNIGAIYQKKLIQENDIPEIISFLREGSLSGINITVPFKNNFIEHVDSISKEAKETNSVNTIYKVENKLVGHNTDIAGFELALRHCKYDTKKKTALIIGAGGVVSSLVVALNRMNIEKIYIKNRSIEKAENLKKRFPEINLVNWDQKVETDMIINATSVGLKPGEKLDINIESFGENKFFYDVIYNPKQTNFLLDAKNYGNRTENGKMMFIYQAHQAFSVWHKIFPEIDNDTIKILDT